MSAEDILKSSEVAALKHNQIISHVSGQKLKRYISLARATVTLNQYTDDQTAYTTIPFFEGSENPVVAFLNNYYQTLANSSPIK